MFGKVVADFILDDEVKKDVVANVKKQKLRFLKLCGKYLK